MWETIVGMLTRPRGTLASLQHPRQAARVGGMALLTVSAVYAFILFVFVIKGYPAAAPSVLGIPVDEHYRVQIWYQVPLFFASTALTAGILVIFERLARRAAQFGVAFGHIALATAVPFGFTTMLVEVGVAILLALGVLTPSATLEWLTGEGAWFAALYQGIGALWLVALVILVADLGLRRGWIVAGVSGLFLVVVYALPIGLLIR